MKRSVTGDEVDLEMGSVIAEGLGKGELDAGPDCQMFGLDLAEANPSKAVKPGLLVDEKDSYRSKTNNDLMLTTAPTGPPIKPQSQRITVRSLHEMYDPSAYSSQNLQEVDPSFKQEEEVACLSGRSELLPPDPSYTSAELPSSRMTTASLPKLDSSLILMASNSSEPAETNPRFTMDSDTLAGVVSSVDDEHHGALMDSTLGLGFVSPVSDRVSLTSPTSTLTGQATSPGDIASLWRLSSPPDPLLIPKQLHLKTDANSLTALTTSSDPSINRHISLFYAGHEYLSEYMSLDPFNISAGISPSTRGSTWSSSPVPTQTQVEELRDLVKIVNSEWMQRLSSATELYTHCSRLSAQKLFDNGTRSLESLFCGNLPRNFEDVFALMHVAFAAAYVLHKEHASYDWSDFFQDALQFHLALSSKSDRDSFLGVMDRWWLPPGLSLRSSLVIKFGPVVGHMSQESTIGMHQMELVKLLKNGEVARNCSDFLDGRSFSRIIVRTSYLIEISGFEEAGIMERNAHFLPGALISNAQGREPIVEHMINAIIYPLQQQRGIEALRDQVSDAEAQLHNGLLRNPREVEVVLISSGKVSTSWSTSCFIDQRRILAQLEIPSYLREVSRMHYQSVRYGYGAFRSILEPGKLVDLGNRLA